MPKFRTNESPEQSHSGFIGLAVVAAMLILMAILFAHGDLTDNHQLQARVFLPELDKAASK
jgi:hypothetical protein